MLRLNELPIGDTNALYQTYSGVLERPGKAAVDVVVKVLRANTSQQDEDKFEQLFSRKYIAADLGDKVVYYRNYIEGITLKEYLKNNDFDNAATMEFSTKLLSILQYLHSEKQFHNKLSTDHILLHDKNLYLISEENQAGRSPQKDIRDFGTVLNSVLKKGKKHPFYTDILANCKGRYSTINDILYRFKNRVSNLKDVPASFHKYVTNQLAEHGSPPSRKGRDAIKAQAHRMVIDNELINTIISDNANQATQQKGSTRWALWLLPLLVILGVGAWLLNRDTTEATPLSFSFSEAKKQELGKAFSFVSNRKKADDLRWRVYDYNGRKIIENTGKSTFDYVPEKPGQYFVTLENLNAPNEVHKDTIQVIWPGGKAEFDFEKVGFNTYMLTSLSPYADSIFYDLGEGLKRMTTETFVHEYGKIDQPRKQKIRFVAYSNGQADVKTQTINLEASKKRAAGDASEKNTPKTPKTTRTTASSYPPPIIRPIAQKAGNPKIGFRLSTSSVDDRLRYVWEANGRQIEGRFSSFFINGQTSIDVKVTAFDGDKMISEVSETFPIKSNTNIRPSPDKPPTDKNNSPFKPIEGTDLFKNNQ